MKDNTHNLYGIQEGALFLGDTYRFALCCGGHEIFESSLRGRQLANKIVAKQKIFEKNILCKIFEKTLSVNFILRLMSRFISNI